MKKLIITFLLYSGFMTATPENWVEHTYHNNLDNPVKIITQYAQVTQRFIQPKLRRKVTSKKMTGTVAHTLNPHESKTIILKGDPLSSHRVVPGNIKVFDTCEHDHAIIPKHNVRNNFDFVITRTKWDKLTIRPSIQAYRPTPMLRHPSTPSSGSG